jgi:hypothetical protein
MVYVDDMYDFKKYGTDIGRFGRMKMSHMLADTTEELLEMADKIGVQRKWIQHAGTSREHFDICMSKRKKAIEWGAKAITWRESGEIMLSRRVPGNVGSM